MTELGTVPVVFKQTVEKHGKRMAMRKKKLGLWSKISWQEYYQQVMFVANALVSLGFRRGESASIIGDNCHEWVFIDMGIQCAGGMSVGIYATNAWPQVEYVVNNSDTRFLFVENEEQLDKWLMFRERSPQLEKVIVWDLKGLRDFKDPMVISFEAFLEIGRTTTSKQPGLFEKTTAAVEPEDVAMIIYTSGTTGDPKGVMLTHRNIIWSVKAVSSVNPLSEHDEVLSYLPLCHVFERLYSVTGSLVFGYTVNFVERPDTVTENMTEISPTVAYGVPRIWEKYYSSIEIQMSKATWFKRTMYHWAVSIGQKRASLVDKNVKVPIFLTICFWMVYIAIFRKLKERIGFDRTRQCSSGGAPISPELLFFFQSMGINLTEGYGLTESSAAATSSRVGAWKYGTVGQVLPGVELKISDDGEILLKSPGIFKGYYKNPEGSA
ncbi:AMP-binding protein, partial [bacterium]|nr:AMP-binding protein [bacterium]